MQHLTTIDNAKAIALLFVIIGHTKGITNDIESFIYSFHMPAFFFISGFLLSDKKLTLHTKTYVVKLSKRLIIPYIFFSTISFFFYIPSCYLKGDDINLLDSLSGILYGTADKLLINPVLWFITCLFLTSLTYFLLSKKLNKITIFLISIFASLILTFFKDETLNRSLLWNLNLVPFSLTFYSLGKLLDKTVLQMLSRINITLRYLIIIVLSPILFYLSNINGRIDLAFLIFNIEWLTLINAFLGITFLFLLSSLIPPNKLFQYLSKNSIIIFPTHILIFSATTGVLLKIFKLSENFRENVHITIAYLAISLILSYPISLILNKKLSYLIGQKNE